MSNVADYLPPGPPDPPRLCPYCDTRRSNHANPIHEPDCPRHPSNRTAPQRDAEVGEEAWERLLDEAFSEAWRVAVIEHDLPDNDDSRDAVANVVQEACDLIRDRLRARVQPRRVTMEEVLRAAEAFREAEGRNPLMETAHIVGVRAALESVGIEITPTEEDDE